MLTYAELNVVLSAMIDEQGTSNRYPPQYRIVCFNYAIQRATSALGWALANRKAPEEALREITQQAIFQTNIQGGIWLDDPTLGKQVWNVLAVTAEAGTTSPSTILPLNPDKSQYRGDLAWDGTGKPCLRITLEQVTRTYIDKSGTMDGNEALAANPLMRTYAYYMTGNTATTSNTNWIPGGTELRVIPKSQTGQKLIGLSYLQAPTELQTINDSVQFPQSCKQQLVDWAAEFLAIRMGDGTTLHSTSAQDAATLFGMNVN